MDKMIIRLSKSLLALLGFSVVGCGPLGGDVAVMYGCPTADFAISGKVVDEDGKPIQGIVISAQRHEWESGEKSSIDEIQPYYFEAVTSDDGTYVMNVQQMEAPDSLYAIDIDGALNGGEYKTARVKLEMEQVKEPGDRDSWYIGGFEAVDVNFNMEVKSPDSQEDAPEE